MTAYRGMAGKLTRDQRQTALMLYNQGWSFGRIGRHFNVSRQAIYYLVRSRLGKVPPLVWTNRDRDEAGVIVTLRRQDTRELYSLHVPGKRYEALQWIAAKIDASGQDWKVLCYSSPQTIVGDMHGKRLTQDKYGRAILDNPEARLLGAIKRLDLLDPSLER
jgi:hypothetical protein